MANKYYSVKELCDISGKDRQTILRYIYDGKLKGTRLSNRWVIADDDWNDFIKGRTETEHCLRLTYDEIKTLLALFEYRNQLSDAENERLDKVELKLSALKTKVEKQNKRT